MPYEQGTGAGLSKERKIGFILLLFFGILAITFGFVQIRNTMFAPFALNTKVPPLDKELINDANALRFRDTDKDGINDFDELYVYTTSPYLADTDSDGTPDAKEIAEGTDPVCPKGKVCGGAEEEGTVVTTTMSDFEARMSEAPADPGTPPPDLEQALQDPVQVRQMLIASGMAKESLDNISDRDLMTMVAEIMTSSTAINEMADEMDAATATGTTRE